MKKKYNKIRKYLLVILFAGFSVPYMVAQSNDKIELTTIHGTVVDKTGKAISNVSVSILDAFMQSFTNDQGNFTIQVPEKSVLYFSKQGFIAQKKEVNKQNLTFSVVLLPEREEFQYQTGYGTRKLSELTTAVSVISANDLSRSFVTSTETALAGKATGLTVLSNVGKEPGFESNSIYIRGIGTENGMRSPYILVDDVERGIGQMDVNEIESVSILKDGASNAQYGQRGANGTILITTKRGFIGKPEIEFISQLGIQKPTNLPAFLNSKEYVTLYDKALQNDGLSLPTDSKYNPTMYDGTQNPLLYPNINWYNEFLNKTAPQQQYKLMFRGGTDFIRYFMLFSYLDQSGLYKHTSENKGYNTNIDYNRFNIRTNLDASVTKSLLVSLDLAGSMENKNMPNSSAGDIYNTLSSLTPNAMPIQYSDSMLGGTSQYQKNPLGMIARTGNRQDRAITMQIKAKAVQQLDFITDGLTAEAALGYNGNTTYGLMRSRTYATYESQSDGTYTRYGENSDISLGMSSTNQGFTYLLNFYGGLKYNKIFGQHGVGGSLRYYQAQTFIRGDNPPYGKLGMNGGANYNFDKRYFLDFSFSYDGSDEFAAGHRFGFFPAVSGAWLISNENFLKDNHTISFLKLRASYGEAGNCKTSGLDRYAYESHWSGFENSSGGYIFGTGFAWSNGAWEGRISNPDLTWETTHNYNVGVDISLLDKLTFNLDGFIHNRNNVILALVNSSPLILGATAPYANTGSVLNKGFEAGVTYKNNINDLNFFLQGNVSFARNKITKTDEVDGLPDNLKRTGYSVTQQRGMLATGYYKNQEDIDKSPYNALYKVRPGDIKYQDVNGDNIINSLDEVAIGSPSVPEWTFGLSAGVDYKGFDISFLVSAFAGRTVYLNNSAVWLLKDNGNATALAYGAWEAGVREDDATYPRLTTESNTNNYRSSSYWMKNGNFLRLSNLEVGYSFSGKWLKTTKIKELRIYANGQNLFTLDYLSDYNLDPEVVNAGITGYPNMKLFNIGLNVKF